MVLCSPYPWLMSTIPLHNPSASTSNIEIYSKVILYQQKAAVIIVVRIEIVNIKSGNTQVEYEYKKIENNIVIFYTNKY